MSRLLGLIIALALTAGGALWLLVQIIIPEHAFRNLVVAAESSSLWGHIGYGLTTSGASLVRKDNRFRHLFQLGPHGEL
jgi:hypothetical protein